ncbi:MAG: Coenzyme F420 hydrogenase/dehydrogenase, beta subunit C-terminal domain [Kiritimatiellia bacterium]
MHICTTEKSQCCGCGACSIICPTQAIQMQIDAEGFETPQVNELLCLNCGKCLEVCGIQNVPLLNPPKVSYAAWHMNPAIREQGSSGSLFTALATLILNRNGIVCGAAFDKDFKHVQHQCIASIENLNALQKSKYVQSSTTKAFENIIQYLKKGRPVLFVGTPCQIASLRQLAKGFDEQLFLCDLVCHGTPSPKVFEAYVTEEEKKVNSTLIDYSFRDKKNGWNFPNICLTFRNGKKIRRLPRLDPFFEGFCRNYFLRESCYQCPYAQSSRTGDVTIADWWRVATSHPHYDNNRGTSLLLVNTDKGKELLRDLEVHGDCFLGIYDLSLAIARNMPLMESAHRPPNRNLFFEVLTQSNSFASAAANYLSFRSAIKIIGRYYIKRLGWIFLRRFQ